MCTICDLKIEFSIDHPMSLPIAVATRRAIDAGVLAAQAGKLSLRLEAINSLKAVQLRVEQSLTLEDFLTLPDFFMLAVESRTWGFFRPTPDGFDPNCRPNPPLLSAEDPSERDSVVVTSETALRQLLAGKISFAAAEEQALIVIDADASRRKKLRSTWNIAYPKTGFSGFFCT